ncbi:TonB-dependent receptor [Govanella unica]|uniref:TonB-dependent receptor n=1 Tax=Govanella unica TaxID=2975056 RepID=A0A9X3U0A7_9PROT|nr:TonB-dependent receptor [Govania unica]MDA5195044.1 TonB-dependent receptor [Govania unica]
MQIEEIIVTARKRAESMQETPISITAFTGQTLEQRNFRSLSDITWMTPNLIFDTGVGNTGGSTNAQIFIRGIGQTDFLFSSDPGVGIYVDDVYFPRLVGSVLELLDFERVEVLRGPQGTLFGKNTIGGAINITSQRPGNEFGGYVEVKTGSRNRIDGRLSIDVPIVDNQLSMRLSAMTRHQDGYVKRILADDDLGNTNANAGRVMLQWTPADDLDIVFTLDGTRRRESASVDELAAVRDNNPEDLLLGLWNMLVAPSYGPGIAYDSRYLSAPRTSNGTGPNVSNLDSWGTSLIITKNFSAFSVKSISAYRDQKTEFGLDQDHSPLTYTETTNHNKDEYFSQELQFSGTNINDRLKWVVGAYYFHEKARDQFDVALASGLYKALSALPFPLLPLGPGITCPPPPGAPPLCAGGAGNPLNIAFDLDATFIDKIKINSYAAFGQATFALTDRLSITGGLRYTDEKKIFSTMLRRNGSGVITVPETTLNKSWNALTPRADVDFKVTQDVLAYASVSRGFKSGGFNGRAQSVAEIDSFDPEYVWSYEAGIKSEFLDHRLRLNGALYYNDYRNMQLTSLRDVGGLIATVTENAGKSRVQGFEIELSAIPVEGLSVSGGVGYTDAKFKRLAPTATVTLDSRFPKIPEWTISGAVQYDFAIGDLGMLSFGADISHRSSYYNDVANSKTSFESGVVLIGTRINYTSPDNRWMLSLFGTNLTDARYIINGLNSFGSFGTASADYGRPREWGVSLKARF